MSINPSNPLTYRELLALSKDDLVKLHDKLLQESNITPGLSYYIDALRYKAQDKQTHWILLFTIIITIATIINVIIAFKLLPK